MATVGLSDLAQHLAGKIQSVRLFPRGKEAKQGSSIGMLEAGKYVGFIRSPVSGKIIDKNKDVESTPVLVHEDPYGRGWLLKMELSGFEGDSPNLKWGKGSDFTSWAEEIIKKLSSQGKIGALASETGMRICGPNSLGVANLATGMTATFSQTLERKPAAGPVGFITQSGAFGTFLFGMALESGLAFKYFISSGNEADDAVFL